MATLTEELYERILAVVSPHELQAGYNSVIQDGYSSVETAVDDVLTAFAKLEEVRDAVTKLKKGAPTNGPSDSLMIAMDSTIALQKEISKGIEQLAPEVLPGKKRKIQEVLSRPDKYTIASQKVDPGKREQKFEFVSDAKPRQQQKIVVQQELKCDGSTGDLGHGKVLEETKSESSDVESDSDSDAVEGSEAAWKALIGAGSGKKSSPRVTEDTENPAIPVAPTPVVIPKQPTGTPISLATAASGQTIGLQPAKDGRSATYFMTIVKDLHSLPSRNINFVVPEVLLGLKESVYEDFNGRQQAKVTSSLEIVIRWATNL
ncbi:hypothetical protein PHYBOEH_008703 [Phytophthora boehmeriae]|uniref:Uncharacterized protein n=1 Tax=Phytophthora boehmeriae TaxID=109152 RepID=A0A8T1W2T4_9STRA|nr:hypothetical protein PHYBOEH_008703 [Phytophthora boehmeriae]